MLRLARKALVTDLPEKLKRLGINSKKAEEERELLLDRQRTVDLIDMVCVKVKLIRFFVQLNTIHVQGDPSGW